MIRKTLLFLGCFVITTTATPFSLAQKSAQAASVVGCYSDLREISEGIIGNGIIRITKENGKYVGTFTELSNELGLAEDEIPLENLVVDESKRIITFDFKSNRYVGTRTRKLEIKPKATGKITKAGIKMNWRGYQGSYGTENSFLKRDNGC